MHGHRHSRLSRNTSVSFPPQRRDGLRLGVEVQPLLPVEVQVAQEAGPGSGEAEHGQRNRNRHVDADLAHIDFVDELARVAAVRGEDSRSVAVRVGVDYFDGVF